MNSAYTRRAMLQLTGQAVLTSALLPKISFAAEEKSSTSFGAVVGEPVGARYGEKMLAKGGNAIDAAITAALVACISLPGKCGIGGYGGYAIIAVAGGKKITTIDFNSPAPAAARDDMFPLDEKGNVKNKLNARGWLAAGAPGTMAGLYLALDRYGTRSLSNVLAPAIYLCEEGVLVSKTNQPDNASTNDASPESSRVKDGRREQNFALAKLLKTLAKHNSVESFYRGEIARGIAAAFKKNGGLVTFEDMAACRAIEAEPLKLKWHGLTIHTTPLTSPGPANLEALSILKMLQWAKLSEEERLHAKLEALRIAWADRNRFFGDPTKVEVDQERLLSFDYAKEMASKIRVALDEQKPVPLNTDETTDSGTVNISATDRHGNMIAITLTHGGSFGAGVSVEEYGLVLGHGMSRFNPRPRRPNSPGSGKRPIHNMCPSMVTRDDKAVFALGGAGGTRIPNSIYEVLLNYVGLGTSIEDAMKAPRLQTTGTMKVELEKHHSKADEAFLKKLGYNVSTANTAYVSAVSFNPKTQSCEGVTRGS